MPAAMVIVPPEQRIRTCLSVENLRRRKKVLRGKVFSWWVEGLEVWGFGFRV